MKTFLLVFLAFTLPFIFWYGVFSFVIWDFRIYEWSLGARLFWIVLSFFSISSSFSLVEHLDR